MKRLLTMALLAMCLTGCASKEPEESRQIRIGVSVYDEYDTFISELTKYFYSYATQDGMNITVEIYSAGKNQLTQNGQVQDMIEDACDVLCINLVDRTSPSKIIDMARQSKTPVIFFNRELVSEDLLRWKDLYYVGADAYQSGEMQGETAVAYLQEHPETDRNGDGLIQYFVLEGEAGHQDAIIRSESCVNKLLEEGIELEKEGYAIADWSRTQAQTQVSQLIKENRHVELILANNDDMALGAIDAYRNAGIEKKDRPAIFGIDGTRVGLEAVQSKELDGTVFNDMKGQAEAMFALAKALSLDEPLDELGLIDQKYIRLPYEVINLDNIDKYLEE